MKVLDMISIALDRVDWTSLMQIAVFLGVILTAFRMQTAERLERIVGCDKHHGVWGVMRRLSHSLMMLSMLWCVMYGYERGWLPWPPVVAVLLSINFNMFVSIMIMRQDIADHLAGRRQVMWRRQAAPGWRRG